MRIELKLDRPLKWFAPRAYTEDDDVRSILMDVCMEMEHQGELRVSGFGQDKWPLDIGTDLPILLEQLPTVINAIDERKSAELHFYGQGVQRYIWFTPVDVNYIARCSSYADWKPNPETEYIDSEVLAVMLAAVRDEFMRAVQATAPGLVTHPWLREWLGQNILY